MKHLKSFVTLAVCLVLLLSFFTVASSAEVDPIDTSRVCSLTIKAVSNGVPVPDMEFSIYRVGDVSGNVPDYTLTGPFATYPIDPANMDADAWGDLATTLHSAAVSMGVQPDVVTVSQRNGLTLEESFPCGLYLIVGTRIETEEFIFECTPFLLCLPNYDYDAKAWDYSVVALPKIIETPKRRIDLSVLKVWDDYWFRDFRPQYITVYLYCDGVLYDTAILNENTSWRYTWQRLSAAREWTIAEDIPASYSVTIRRQSETQYVITNRSNFPPPSVTPTSPPKLPQTGLLWWPVYTLAGVGFLLLLLGFVSMKLHRPQPVTGLNPSDDGQEHEKE